MQTPSSSSSPATAPISAIPPTLKAPFCPSNAMQAISAPRACPEPEFSAALQRFAAQRLLVLIDACHSAGAGSFKGGSAGEPLALGYSEKSLGRLAQGTGRVLIASSRASEKSLVFPSARNSVFTSHLLDALRGQAWTRGDGLIRVFEIFNHISEMVNRQVPGRQHPVFKANDLEDNFPVALGPGAGSSRLLRRLHPQPIPTSGASLETSCRISIPQDPRIRKSGRARVEIPLGYTSTIPAEPAGSRPCAHSASVEGDQEFADNP